MTIIDRRALIGGLIAGSAAMTLPAFANDEAEPTIPFDFDHHQKTVSKALQIKINEAIVRVFSEFNTWSIRYLIADEVNQFATKLQSIGAIDQFLVLCDETNNPPEIVAANQLVVDVWYTTNGRSFVIHGSTSETTTSVLI